MTKQEAGNASIDWTDVSTNPVSPEVKQFLRQKFESIEMGELRSSYPDWLCDRCKGQQVLDIGAVQHDASFYTSGNWLHGRLAEVADRLIGLDVLEKEVAALRDRGFDIRLLDATSDESLGMEFDRVVVGDVIEHVNDPVALMKFARRHLTSDGRILVKTPSPFYWRRVLSTIHNPATLVNAEHVSWVTPTNALEIARRSNLSLVRCLYVTGRPTGPVKALLHAAARIAGLSAGLLAWDYVYELESG